MKNLGVWGKGVKYNKSAGLLILYALIITTIAGTAQAFTADLANYTFTTATAEITRANDSATSNYLSTTGNVEFPDVPSGFIFSAINSTNSDGWLNGSNVPEFSRYVSHWGYVVWKTSTTSFDQCMIAQANASTDRVSICLTDVTTTPRFAVVYHTGSVTISQNATQMATATDGNCHVGVWQFNTTTNHTKISVKGVTHVGSSSAGPVSSTAGLYVGRMQAATNYRPFNGTIYAFGLGSQSLSSSDVTALQNTYCNPTVQVNFSSTVRNVPTNYLGFQYTGSYSLGNASRIDTNGDGSLDTYANYTGARTESLEAGGKRARIDADFRNVLSTTNYQTFTYNQATSSNGGNIDNHKTTISYMNSIGGVAEIVLAYMPNTLANNASSCSYGDDSDARKTCSPSNYTLWTNMVVDYLDEVDCDVYTSTCELEVWNEPYLNQFWQENGTCAEKTTAYMTLYNYTYAAVKAAYPTLKVGGPVGHYNNACGLNITRDFIGNYSNMTDFIAMHEYGSLALLSDEVQDGIDYVRGLGWTGEIKFTEMNDNIDSETWTNPVRGETAINKVFVRTLNTDYNTTGFTVYQWTQTGVPINNYTCYYQPGSYYAASLGLNGTGLKQFCYNATKYFSEAHSGGMMVVNTTNDDSNLETLASMNSTSVSSNYLTIVNSGSTDAILTVVLNGKTINSAMNIRTGTNYSVTGSQFIVTVPAYETQSFLLNETTDTISFNATQPNTPVSIVEPNNQTFNFTINNDGNQTTSILWRINGTQETSCDDSTSCTFLGNYSTQGNWTVNVTVSALTNTISYEWTLSVNNTNSPISFNTVYPTSNPTINAGESQLLNFSLTNSDSITYTATWYNEGVNITACFNTTSCTISTLATNPTATYNISVEVVASSNTINNEWNLSVTSQADQDINSICTNGSGALGDLAGWLPTIAIVLAAAVAIGVIGLYNSGALPSIGFNSLGSIALIIVGAAITITIGLNVVVSAIC